MSNRDNIIKKLGILKEFTNKYDEMTDILNKLQKEIDNPRINSKQQAHNLIKMNKLNKTFTEELIKLYDTIEEKYIIFMDEIHIIAYFNIMVKKLKYMVEDKLVQLFPEDIIDIETNDDMLFIKISNKCYNNNDKKITIGTKQYIIDACPLLIYYDKNNLIIEKCKSNCCIKIDKYEINYKDLDTEWLYIYNILQKYQQKINIDLLTDQLYKKYSEEIDEIMEINSSILIDELST